MDKDLKEYLKKHSKPDNLKSFWQLANSLVSYCLLLVFMYWSLKVSYFITLVLALLASGMLVRVFVIFHDCGHGSFFSSPRANIFLGHVLGLLLFIPYTYWKYDHASHHTSLCNLDYCGRGDIWTLSLKDYRKASRWGRFKYRLNRNSLILFLFSPFFFKNRFLPKKSPTGVSYNIHLVNLWIVLLFIAMHYAIGVKAFILIQYPVILFACIAGIWLFYVQHQFDQALWVRSDRWNHQQAVFQGTSFYRLPKIIQWFSGNIGFHHIHHLSSGIANYNLEKCHRNNPLFEKVTKLSFIPSLKTLNNRLWDEDRSRFVSFKEV